MDTVHGPRGDEITNKLGQPMSLPKKRILPVDDMLDLILSEPEKRAYQGFKYYVEFRFPEAGSSGVSMHIGCRDSRLTALDALNGCRVIACDVSGNALDFQRSLFTGLHDWINSAGGGLDTRHTAGEKVLGGFNGEVDHITCRSVFNSREYRGNPIQDCKLMLNAIKPKGTILVDVDEKTRPQQEKPSGEVALKKAVDETSNVEIEEVGKFMLTGSGSDICKLFRVKKH